MTGYSGSIEAQPLKNNYFRQVIFTGKHAQLVVMCLQPGEEIETAAPYAKLLKSIYPRPTSVRVNCTRSL